MAFRGIQVDVIYDRSETEERAMILLQAMVDMMKKQEQSSYVHSIFELTAHWDNANCDGYCWYEEAKELLGIHE